MRTEIGFLAIITFLTFIARIIWWRNVSKIDRSVTEAGPLSQSTQMTWLQETSDINPIVPEDTATGQDSMGDAELQIAEDKVEVAIFLTINDFPWNYEWITIVQSQPQIIATVKNEWSLWQRNDDAFENLAWYIFGDNSGGKKIAMTSPVTREVLTDTSYETAFIMPDGWTMDNLPAPSTERIEIKEIPGVLRASWRFSGYVTQDAVDREREAFQQRLEEEQITWHGRPTLAQYDGPWVAARNRRNELWVSLNP